MSNLFSNTEIELFGITPWKYSSTDEKPSCRLDEEFSIWDYKINHERFREIIDGKSHLFSPWMPLMISKIIGEK